MSPQPARPRPTLIYRIVHIDNLATLARRGYVHAPASQPEDGLAYRAIHDESIRLRRGGRSVPCGPGGTVDDYVSFYLGPRSPMLYRIWKGTVPCEGGQRSVVYLVSSVEKLQELHIPFVFSDGHGLSAITVGTTIQPTWNALTGRLSCLASGSTPKTIQTAVVASRPSSWCLAPFLGRRSSESGFSMRRCGRTWKPGFAGEATPLPYLRIKEDWYYLG